MTGPAHRWSYQETGRGVFTLSWGGHDLARVMWARLPLHPHRTMVRIIDGLNGHRPQRDRTWSFTWDDATVSAVLRHNGAEQGELIWSRPDIRNPEKWLVRALDGLNRPGTAADPVPEPAPPTHLRRVI
jgi:hypothetical protein